MRIAVNRTHLLALSLVIVSCAPSLYLDNEMASAYLERVSKPQWEGVDTCFATEFGSEWVADGLRPYTRPHAPTFTFDLHMANEDSVTIAYTGSDGSLVCAPFSLLLERGNYTYRIKPFGFSPGVYMNTLRIGRTVWKKELTLLHYGN
jgi:hypothetical protein